MPTVTLERTFAAPQDRVFEYVSKTEHLLKWWGPETVRVTEHQLSMERPGPYVSVFENDDGGRFKVSGQVTHVDRPNSIGFTWAWHDENDKRGVESHVTIKLVPAQNGGTDFTLTHVDLPDEESAQNHTGGWTSSLRKLEALANA